uniref:Tetraspanin n=1 Tax=Oryzias melastigma TaxID=30732 RepID=A0A3B3DLV3_ORYME
MGFFTFVKLMMTLVDLLIFLSGTTIMALGLWVSLDRGTYLRLLGPFPDRALEFLNVGYYCIATGGVMVLLGLVGFCGAQKQSKCLLLGFFSIILIIFITQLAAAAVLLYYSADAADILTEWLKYMYGMDTMITNIWNTTMTKMNCCGFFNYTDFLGSRFEAQNQGNLPPSCCMTDIGPCSRAEAERRQVKGCYEVILQSLTYHGNIVGGILVSIEGLEVNMQNTKQSTF